MDDSSSPLAGVYLPRDDDLGSSDEVKVFKDEGEDDLEGLDGFNASFSEELQAALLEDKSLLIQETENLSIKDELLALEPPPGVPPGPHHLLESKPTQMPTVVGHRSGQFY